MRQVCWSTEAAVVVYGVGQICQSLNTALDQHKCMVGDPAICINNRFVTEAASNIGWACDVQKRRIGLTYCYEKTTQVIDQRRAVVRVALNYELAYVSRD